MYNVQGNLTDSRLYTHWESPQKNIHISWITADRKTFSTYCFNGHKNSQNYGLALQLKIVEKSIKTL